MDILYTETEVLTVQRTVLKTASDDVIHVLDIGAALLGGIGKLLESEQ